MYLNCISLTLVFATNLSAQLNLERRILQIIENLENMKVILSSNRLN